MASAQVLGGGTVNLDSVAFEASLQHAARARDGARGAERAPARHRVHARRAARSPAAARSRGARRAPAAPAPAPRARRCGPAAAPCSARRRAATRSRSTARPGGRRCAARCRVHAERESLAVFDAGAFGEPSTQQAADLLSDWGAERRRRWCCWSADEAAAGKSFRNLARVEVMPVEDAGVADVIGAASLLVSQAALPALVGARPCRAAMASPMPRRARLMDAEPGDHPPGRVREDVRARRGRQVHVPRPRRAHKTQIRQAVEELFERQRGRGPHRVACKSKPKRRGQTSGTLAPVEEGDRPGARGRHDPDLRGAGGGTE